MTPQTRRDPITGKLVPWDRSEKAKEVERATLEARKGERKNGKVKAPKQLPMFDEELRTIAQEHEVGDLLVTPEVTNAPRTAFVSQTLADLRKKWVDIGPSKRSGATGDKLMKQYRKLSLEFWQLTGKHPPLIHADL